MAKAPVPEISLITYTTTCRRKDGKKLPHSLRYTSELDNDTLTEKWRCRNCPTEFVRHTNIRPALTEKKVWGSAGRPIA